MLYEDPEYIKMANKLKDEKNAELDHTIAKDKKEEHSKLHITKHKSTNDSVIAYIKDMLEKKYMVNYKGEFNSMRDFSIQYESKCENDNVQKVHIDKIPVKFIEHEYSKIRSAKYIEQFLDGEWKVMTIRYKERPCKGFKRIAADDKMDKQMINYDNGVNPTIYYKYRKTWENLSDIAKCMLKSIHNVDNFGYSGGELDKLYVYAKNHGWFDELKNVNTQLQIAC